MLWRAANTPPDPMVPPQAREPGVSLDESPDLLRQGLADPQAAFPETAAPAPQAPRSNRGSAEIPRKRPVAVAHTDWGPPPTGVSPAVRRLAQSREPANAALSGASVSDPRHPAQDQRLQELFRRQHQRVQQGRIAPEGGDL